MLLVKMETSTLDLATTDSRFDRIHLDEWAPGLLGRPLSVAHGPQPKTISLGLPFLEQIELHSRPLPFQPDSDHLAARFSLNRADWMQ